MLEQQKDFFLPWNKQSQCDLMSYKLFTANGANVRHVLNRLQITNYFEWPSRHHEIKNIYP